MGLPCLSCQDRSGDKAICCLTVEEAANDRSSKCKQFGNLIYIVVFIYSETKANCEFFIHMYMLLVVFKISERKQNATVIVMVFPSRIRM